MSNRIEMRIVIFTDFDGVLHHASAAQIEWEGNEWRVVGQDLFCWAPLLWKLIAPHPIDVVIHSTWRHSHSLDELRKRFPEAMRPRIIDITGRVNRYESIVNYVEDNGIGIENFLVLDDMPEEFPAKWGPLVSCDGETGIADHQVQQKIRYFLEMDSRLATTSD